MMTAAELAQYEHWKEEAQFLRLQNRHLEGELRACQPALYRADQKIDRLEQRVAKLSEENRRLRQQLTDRTPPPAPPPPFVKLPRQRRGKPGRPGRRPGHPPDFRPMPSRIDHDLEVPLPTDARGQSLCPRHGTVLQDVQRHTNVVEDLIPAKVVVTCYHSTSGYCPQCQGYVRSRHPQQPPPAPVPQPQLGINTLAMAAVLRTQHRLPYAQIGAVFANLAGLRVCPGALARQMQRMGGWFAGEYDHLQRYLRGREIVGADETGWPVNGKGWWLWTLTDAQHTLYHVDKSRGRKVIAGLLGQGFAGWLVSDFLSVYDQASPRQQKCLTHLARDLHQRAQKRPEFAQSGFCRRLRRLLKDMVQLKQRRRRLKAAVYWRRVARVEQRLEALSRTQSQDPEVRRLATRLRDYRQSLTPFLHVTKLPGDNNHTEREIRPIAVFRKISGGSRSERGAKATATVASLVRTAVNKGRDAVGTIKQLLQHVWSGGQTPILTPDAGSPP